MKNLIIVVTAVMVSAVACNSSSAHDVYKKPMQEKFNLKSISCKACHPNNKDKSIHNKFGMYFVEIFKGKDITKKYDAATEAGDEAKEKYEAQMVDDFKKALKIVEKKKMTFEDMINAGLMNGTRLNVAKDKK